MIRTLALILLACTGCHHKAPVQPASHEGSGQETPGGGRRQDRGPKRWPIAVNGIKARVRLARTRSDHYGGLSGVKRLGPDEGMLFKYAEKELRRFWMKGCRVALDIAFLDDQLKILEVVTLPAPTARTTDVDMPRAVSPVPVRWVLEMPAGFFRRHGLTRGAVVSVPPGVRSARAE